ncbi:MAG: DEAD/DEAH box helicase [Desulfobulbaceae bacterium]|nr:DEAD/DEAH box helicase [Desulfobulbaceae bacterium]
MNFSNFSLHHRIAAAIQRCGFTQPTPIQEQAIPAILAGRDVIGLAQTGTGKTAAYMLPLLHQLIRAKSRQPRALVLAPTRELAEQINTFTKDIIQGTHLRSIAIYGGVSKQAQIDRIRQGVDIVVACPGRMLDILGDRAINLNQVECLVLDEADHMFDQGFLPDVRRIAQNLPKKKQTLIFSATMPAEINILVEDILNDPVRVQISPNRSVDAISHRLYRLVQTQKTPLLMHLLRDETVRSALVFTRTKHKAKKLAAKLTASGFSATSLQGNLSQNMRKQAVDGFKSGRFNVLVATDIAARGIDIAGISHVFNYDMPDTTEAYIHRTGRTGRAALAGEALSFATSDDLYLVKRIERFLPKGLQHCKIEEYILEAPSQTEADAAAPPMPARAAQSYSPRNGSNRSSRPGQASDSRRSRKRSTARPAGAKR